MHAETFCSGDSDQEVSFLKFHTSAKFSSTNLFMNLKVHLILLQKCRTNHGLCYECVFALQWRKGVPVEVIPMAYVPVVRKMEKLGLKPVLRMAKAKAVSIL